MNISPCNKSRSAKEYLLCSPLLTMSLSIILLTGWKKCNKLLLINSSIYLLGNKEDVSENVREVYVLWAERFALAHKLKFFEISAKTGYNVSNAFNQIRLDILNKTRDITTINDNFSSSQRTLSTLSIVLSSQKVKDSRHKGN